MSCHLENLSALPSLFLLLITHQSIAQENEVPDRAEGEGQYERLVLRGGYIIDGTGAPAYGPADVVIENDKNYPDPRGRHTGKTN